MTAAMQFVDDFMAGQRDCQKGIPHEAGHSEAYDRGYGAEYEWNCIQDEMKEKECGHQTRA